jgi:hypothetical protein
MVNLEHSADEHSILDPNTIILMDQLETVLSSGGATDGWTLLHQQVNNHTVAHAYSSPYTGFYQWDWAHSRLFDILLLTQTFERVRI